MATVPEQMAMPYQPLSYFLDLLEEPNRSAVRKLMLDNPQLFGRAYGSAHNHQNWEGGYFDHIQDFCNIASVLYEALSSKRPMPFGLSSVFLVAFLHDLEKPWKYEVVKRRLRLKPEFRDRSFVNRFKLDLMKKYGIKLTKDERNAFDYVEGEIGNYSPYKRGMGKLAAFCHMCDIASARLMPEHPLKHDDPWPGCSDRSHRR